MLPRNELESAEREVFGVEVLFVASGWTERGGGQLR